MCQRNRPLQVKIRSLCEKSQLEIPGKKHENSTLRL